MKATTRTETQIDADKFDCGLHSLASKAETYAANGPRQSRVAWRSIALALWNARPAVRTLMHKDDREATR